MPVTKCKPVILTTVVLTYGNQFMLVIYAKCIYRGKWMNAKWNEMPKHVNMITHNPDAWVIQTIY